MTEIEKMFENAGVIKFDQCDYYKKYKLYCHQKDCSKCTLDVNYRHIYPYFTADKQLGLIKFLAKTYELSINWNEQYCSYRFVIRDYKNGRLNHSVCSHEVPFEEMLAYLVNRIWQSLTDQEKEEIRNILNA